METRVAAGFPASESGRSEPPPDVAVAPHPARAAAMGMAIATHHVLRIGARLRRQAVPVRGATVSLPDDKNGPLRDQPRDHAWLASASGASAMSASRLCG